MKKVLFLYISFFMAGCALAQSQSTVLYSKQFDNSLLLKDCISILEKEFDLEFSYPSEIAQRIISPPPLRSTPILENYLNQLFLTLGFEYQLVDNEKILLRPKIKNASEAIDAYTWSGNIYDSSSGEPIPYALVSSADLKTYTYTDEQGAFLLQLKPHHADQKMTVHALGYLDQHFVPSQDKLPSKIKLGQSPITLSAVSILEDKPIRVLTGKNLEVRGDNSMSIQTVGGLYGEDIFREIQMVTAGIQANDDSDAGIRIRGGQDNQTLIVLDEIPIYRADHYYGIFSGINGKYIDEYSIYKNATPIQYGGKMSGMVDMQSAEDVEKISGQINGDLLSANGMLKIPFGKNVGLQVAGRSSYTNLTRNKTFDLSNQNNLVGAQDEDQVSYVVNEPDFNFYDGNAKLHGQFGNFKIEGNFYGSKDIFENNYNREFNFNPNFEFREARELFVHTNSWQNLGASLVLNYKKGPWESEFVSYLTDYQTNNTIEANLELRQLTIDRIARFGTETANTIQDNGQKFRLNYSENKHAGTVGFETVSHKSELIINNNDVKSFNREGDGRELTGYGQWEWNPSSSWQMQLGSRFTHFEQGENDAWYTLPQWQLKYFAGSHGMLKSSVSRKAQFVREVTFQDRLGQTTELLFLSDLKSLPVGTSWNYMLGGALYFSKFTFDTEFYLKNTEGELAFLSRTIGVNDGDISPNVKNDAAIFVGTGKTIGADFTLSFVEKNYNGSIAYTLSKSTNQFPEIYQNKEIASSLDTRHQLKWTNRYDWNRFSFFGSYVFASGRPYTDISSLSMEVMIGNADPEDLIKRLPDYHRLDLGIDFTIPIDKSKLTIGLSCFNITDHKNVKYQQNIYSFRNQNTMNALNAVVGSQALQLDRTYNIGIGWKF